MQWRRKPDKCGGANVDETYDKSDEKSLRYCVILHLVNVTTLHVAWENSAR